MMVKIKEGAVLIAIHIYCLLIFQTKYTFKIDKPETIVLIHCLSFPNVLTFHKI